MSSSATSIWSRRSRGRSRIPVAVKVAPYFSAMANMAARLTKAGASGLVLFNRFVQPDIVLEELEVSPHLVLSTSDELRLALRWIAILRGRVEASLAATGGAHTPDDVLKLLLAGADCVMLASSLLHQGPEPCRHAGARRRGLDDRTRLRVGGADEGLAVASSRAPTRTPSSAPIT